MILKLPKIIGHRGAKALAPENTILSINEAINHNLKWIEIDVKISKDNKSKEGSFELLDSSTLTISIGSKKHTAHFAREGYHIFIHLDILNLFQY